MWCVQINICSEWPFQIIKWSCCCHCSQNTTMKVTVNHFCPMLSYSFSKRSARCQDGPKKNETHLPVLCTKGRSFTCVFRQSIALQVISSQVIVSVPLPSFYYLLLLLFLDWSSPQTVHLWPLFLHLDIDKELQNKINSGFQITRW